MKEVKLGLVGLGYIGRIHLRNCLKLKNAKLTAVCDASKKALNQAKKSGIKKRYTDYQKLLKDKDIDAVIIALPTFLHERCAVEAADAGKDIFLEKPLARDVKEGKEILSVTNGNGVKLMIGYPNRFHDSFIDLKRQMEEGLIGDVENAYAVLIGPGPFFHRAERGNPRPVPEWWFEKDLTGGGVLIDYGCHLMNLIHWYFGEIINIKSYLGYRFDLDIEDHATCMAEFKSGTTSIINVGWFSQESLLKIELYGTVRNALGHNKAPNKVVAVVQQLLNTSSYWVPFRREIEHFVDCISHDTFPEPSGEEGLRDLEIICQAYENRIF